MYANPKHLHDREIKVRVDEDTFNLIQALAGLPPHPVRGALLRASR